MVLLRVVVVLLMVIVGLVLREVIAIKRQTMHSMEVDLVLAEVVRDSRVVMVDLDNLNIAVQSIRDKMEKILLLVIPPIPHKM